MNAIDAVSWKVKAVAAVAVVVLIAGTGAGIAWWATSTSYNADMSDLKAAHLKEKGQWDADRLAITTKAQQDTAAALQRTKDAQTAAAALDAEWQEKYDNALKENADLRGDVSSGNRRVRILTANLATAELAARQHAASGNSSTGSVGDAAGVELSAAAGQRVLDIRAGIISDQAKLTYLQGYVRGVVNMCKR